MYQCNTLNPFIKLFNKLYIHQHFNLHYVCKIAQICQVTQICQLNYSQHGNLLIFLIPKSLQSNEIIHITLLIFKQQFTHHAYIYAVYFMQLVSCVQAHDSKLTSLCTLTIITLNNSLSIACIPLSKHKISYSNNQLFTKFTTHIYAGQSIRSKSCKHALIPFVTNIISSILLWEKG